MYLEVVVEDKKLDSMVKILQWTPEWDTKVSKILFPPLRNLESKNG